MELVRFADRKRKRVDERASDEIFLSRRMFLFKGMFVVGFGGLAAKLGKMQVIDVRQYANQVKGNAQRFEVLNAPRGMIVIATTMFSRKTGLAGRFRFCRPISRTTATSSTTFASN